MANESSLESAGGKGEDKVDIIRSSRYSDSGQLEIECCLESAGGKGEDKVDIIRSSRYSDSGQLEIECYTTFLNESRERFNENWTKPFKKETKETLDDFDQIRFLGSGSFGSVILVMHKPIQKYYAMKCMEKEKIIEKQQIEHTRNEKMVLQCINHPLAVYLMYCFKDNSFIYFVMPFVNSGELFDHLRRFKKFDEVQARFYASQVVLALEYLHFLNLIYRDLKPENILMDNTGYLKLTDFGFCKRMTSSRTYSMCGTPEYIAPEVILNKGYGKSVDWWALGILVYEMVAGGPPFTSSDEIQIYEKIVQTRYKMPSHFTADLKDLVKNILRSNLSRRYGNLKNGVEDIKGHTWFRPTNWLATLNRKMIAPYIPSCSFLEVSDDREKLPNIIIAKDNKYDKEFADF